MKSASFWEEEEKKLLIVLLTYKLQPSIVVKFEKVPKMVANKPHLGFEKEKGFLMLQHSICSFGKIKTDR